MSDPFQNPASFNPATFNPAEFNPVTAGPLWPGHPAYPGRRADEEWAAYQASLRASAQAGGAHAAHTQPEFSTPAQTYRVPSKPAQTPARLKALQQLVDQRVLSNEDARGFVNADGRVGDSAWRVLREHLAGRATQDSERPLPAAGSSPSLSQRPVAAAGQQLSAEQALRRRRREQTDADDRNQQRRARSSAQRRADLVAEVEALAPQAIAGLRRAGWPGGRLLNVRGRFRRKEIAAWAVGGYRFRGKADGSAGRFNELYLLSDGRWMYGYDGEPQSFADIVSSFAGGMNTPGSLMVSELPEGVVEALRELSRL